MALRKGKETKSVARDEVCLRLPYFDLSKVMEDRTRNRTETVRPLCTSVSTEQCKRSYQHSHIKSVWHFF